MPRTTPYPKEDSPVTLAAIKQLIDAATQRTIDELSLRITSIETRQTAIEATSSQQQDELVRLKESHAELQQRCQLLETREEQSRRHSYSFELLLHGIPEDDQPVWPKVTAFLNDMDLATYIERIDGAVFRLGRPTMRDGNDPHPRPILIRLLSRNIRAPLLERAGKKQSTNGSPYFSSHLTRLQINELRLKASSATARNSDTASATVAMER